MQDSILELNALLKQIISRFRVLSGCPQHMVVFNIG